MKPILFVTGNDEKLRDARFALKQFDISVEKFEIQSHEIQHHDAKQIALHKAKVAFETTKKPLVINDSSWSIPALNGFPGGYMKDVTDWLTTNDFLALMAGKPDKRILLHEVVVYVDTSGSKVFETLREGVFVKTPAGKSNPSFARVVKMENDDVTIAQIFDVAGERATDKLDRYQHWNKFGEWYKNNA